ncbi:cytochrome c oxidase assembly protein [uncultured Arthrobacter sp.]|uniref:cytochrome c oxidase assembly protein n=1 Tax=uncultured Arthrobacter sp. TaxID=114050 RepID=UPI00261D24BC|nr:cytochrome c oxidase assembly protein [uncultured Arthrobacter sp.]
MSVGVRSGAIVGLAAAALLGMLWAYSLGTDAEVSVLDPTGQTLLVMSTAAKLLFNLAAACTIGALTLVCFALSSSEPAYNVGLRFAAGSATVWTFTAALLNMLNFQLVGGASLLSGAFLPDFIGFSTTAEVGRSGLLSFVIAASVCALSFVIHRRSAVVGTAVLAFTGLLPLILNSHAEGAGDHADNTMFLVLHVGAAAVWLGGLVSVAVLHRVLAPERLGAVVGRYSTLALAAFVVLGFSGSLTAWDQLGSLSNLGTTYGVIVVAKSAAFGVLGIFGAVHRQRILKQLERDPRQGTRRFMVLVVAELAVMGAASGLAATLARTPAPPLESAPTDRPLPAPDEWSFMSEWTIDPLWALVCAFGVVVYLVGVRRIRRAGESWPIHRTMFWLVGVAALFTITNGGIHVYQGYLLNFHVLTQMLISTVVPLLLLPGAPLELATRTIRPRSDGSAGGAEFIQVIVRPAVAAATAAPYVPVLVLAGSLVATYYTPLLEFSALNQPGYALMTLLALASGCFFTAALVGTTPVDQRLLKKRLAALAGTAVLYAVYGWGLWTQGEALEGAWAQSVRPWGPLPVIAPETAGLILWAIAGGTTTALAAIITRRTPTIKDVTTKPGTIRQSQGRALISSGGLAATQIDGPRVTAQGTQQD